MAQTMLGSGWILIWNIENQRRKMRRRIFFTLMNLETAKFLSWLIPIRFCREGRLKKVVRTGHLVAFRLSWRTGRKTWSCVQFTDLILNKSSSEIFWLLFQTQVWKCRSILLRFMTWMAMCTAILCGVFLPPWKNTSRNVQWVGLLLSQISTNKWFFTLDKKSRKLVR